MSWPAHAHASQSSRLMHTHRNRPSSCTRTVLRGALLLLAGHPFLALQRVGGLAQRAALGRALGRVLVQEERGAGRREGGGCAVSRRMPERVAVGRGLEGVRCGGGVRAGQVQWDTELVGELKQQCAPRAARPAAGWHPCLAQSSDQPSVSPPLPPGQPSGAAPRCSSPEERKRGGRAVACRQPSAPEYLLQVLNMCVHAIQGEAAGLQSCAAMVRGCAALPTAPPGSLACAFLMS